MSSEDQMPSEAALLHTGVRVAAGRIRAEYLEMPGLTLTAAQVGRLCAIEATICRDALKILVNERFLMPVRESFARVRTIA